MSRNQFVLGDLIIYTASLLEARQAYDEIIEKNMAERAGSVTLWNGKVIGWSRMTSQPLPANPPSER
jgi:hypothetical protein